MADLAMRSLLTGIQQPTPRGEQGRKEPLAPGLCRNQWGEGVVRAEIAAQTRARDDMVQPVAQQRHVADHSVEPRERHLDPGRGDQDQPLHPFGMRCGIGRGHSPAQRKAHQREIPAQPLIGQQVVELAQQNRAVVPSAHRVRPAPAIEVIDQHPVAQPPQPLGQRIPDRRWRAQPVDRHDNRPPRRAEPLVMRDPLRQDREFARRGLTLCLGDGGAQRLADKGGGAEQNEKEQPVHRS